jgi:hypothetical protein
MKDSAENRAIGGNLGLDFGGLGFGLGEIMPKKKIGNRERSADSNRVRPFDGMGTDCLMRKGFGVWWDPLVYVLF